MVRTTRRRRLGLAEYHKKAGVYTPGTSLGESVSIQEIVRFRGRRSDKRRPRFPGRNLVEPRNQVVQSPTARDPLWYVPFRQPPLPDVADFEVASTLRKCDPVAKSPHATVTVVTSALATRLLLCFFVAQLALSPGTKGCPLRTSNRCYSRLRRSRFVTAEGLSSRCRRDRFYRDGDRQ